ncbi:hypothetical protein BD779DRAFT_1536508 [Infundibulicybe gibba]|nr:hypothetical protein BD779DRAFT_1536508 [Infundibulicybe gibba]
MYSLNLPFNSAYTQNPTVATEMTIAHGVVKSPRNGELVAEFTIDGVVHQYTARFSPEIKLVGSMILTYLARDELKGEAAFSGESDGDSFDLHLSSEGVSIVCGSPAEQGNVFGCPPNPTTAASGIVTATSSTTFVAVFYVDDVRQTFTASFAPPLSTFASDLVKLYFNNPGDLIGAPAFSGEVGISGLHIQLSSPGVTTSGDLRKHTTPRLTISGTGRKLGVGTTVLRLS